MSLVLIDKSALVRGLEISVDDKFRFCAVTRLEVHLERPIWPGDEGLE